MDIPVINRIIAGEELPSVSSSLLISPPAISLFFKWGALAIAFLASFSTLVKAIRLIAINYFTANSSPASQEAAYDYPDGDDDDESLSSTSYNSSDSEVDDDEAKDEDFRVKNGGRSRVRWRSCASSLRRRKNNSLVELSSLFMTGKNVVRLWENAALGMVSPGVSENGMIFPALFSGKVGVSADRLLRMWDARIGGWESPTGNVAVSETNRSGGIVLREGASSGLCAGDVRMAGSRFVPFTEADVDAWMDASSRN